MYWFSLDPTLLYRRSQDFTGFSFLMVYHTDINYKNSAKWMYYLCTASHLILLWLEIITCGGSLISPHVVLSAYHCSCNWIGQGQHVDYTTLNSFAKLGAHNLNHQTYIKKKIIDVKFPPNPVPYSPSLEIPPNKHDLVMFILKEPVKFSLKISPICLPIQGECRKINI